MYYTEKEGTKYLILLHYIVIGKGKDVKFMRACLNIGRIGGEKSVEVLSLNKRVV